MATNLSPPLPPPPLLPPPHGFHVPVIAIALIGIIATGILLISYYIFVIKCCLNLHRVDVLNRLLSRRRHLDAETTSATTATSSPAAKGLDEAVIRSIPVIKYRKSSDRRHKLLEEANNPEIECAVCLSEFEEGEKLRVIPNCCHAFHIDCIDVWLQNSANCPLCRSSISASSVLYNPDIIKNFNRSRSRNSDDSFSGDDNDYVVIEIQGNNLNEPRLINPTNSLLDEEGRSVMEKENKVLSSGRRHVCSMGDELIDSMMRKKDDEFRVEPIRRSISMDLSSINNREFRLEIEECCKGEATSNNNNNNMEEVIRSGSSHSSSSSNSKVRRSIFSFGYGRSSKGSLIQRVQLDP